MNKESEIISNLKPEETSRICNKLTKIEIHDDLYELMAISIKNNRTLAFLSNHQGYLETEMWIQVSNKIQKNGNMENFKGLCWPYSEPATMANVGDQFSIRQKYYEDNGLKLLPFIRESDRQHPKYKNYINGEMEENHKKSGLFLRNVFKGKYGIILTPEGTIKGGRINNITNNPEGIQPITDYSLTNLVLNKKNVDIIPVAVSGSYIVMDSTNYTCSNNIPLWLKNNITVMKLSAREKIQVESLMQIDNKIDYLFYYYIAPLLPLEERGFYSQRTNLKNIF